MKISSRWSNPSIIDSKVVSQILAASRQAYVPPLPASKVEKYIDHPLKTTFSPRNVNQVVYHFSRFVNHRFRDAGVEDIEVGGVFGLMLSFKLPDEKTYEFRILHQTNITSGDVVLTELMDKILAKTPLLAERLRLNRDRYRLEVPHVDGASHARRTV